MCFTDELARLNKEQMKAIKNEATEISVMKKLMFYCQHILGMGHLIRSMEIVRSLTPDFEVCVINGGQVINGFKAPPSVRVINLLAIKSDSEFNELISVDPNLDIETVKAMRYQQLLTVLEAFRPDVLIIELFPFGRRRFSFELIPLIEAAKKKGQSLALACAILW